MVTTFLLQVLDSDCVRFKKAASESKQPVGGWVRFLVLWWTEEKLWSIAQVTSSPQIWGANLWSKSTGRPPAYWPSPGAGRLSWMGIKLDWAPPGPTCHCLLASHLFATEKYSFAFFGPAWKKAGTWTSLELCWKIFLTKSTVRAKIDTHTQRKIFQLWR